MIQQHKNTRVTAGRTLIRRHVLAVRPEGAGDEAAVTAASVPPLSGGSGRHGSETAHAVTVAGSAEAGTVCRSRSRRTAGSPAPMVHILRHGRAGPAEVAASHSV